MSDDSELREQLQRLAGPMPDDDAAFVTMQRRVRVARRRRASAAIGGLGAACLIGITAFAVAGRDAAGNRIQPAHVGNDDQPLITTGRTGGTDAIAIGGTDSSSTTPGSTDPTASTEPTESSDDTSSSSTPSTTPTTPSSVDDHGNDNGNGNGNGVPANTAPPLITASAPSAPSTVDDNGQTPPAGTSIDRTFNATGGTVVVHLGPSGLSLVSVNPAPGYTVVIERNDGDRVRVSFTSADRSFRVEAGNGGTQITGEVSEHGGSGGGGSDDGGGSGHP